MAVLTREEFFDRLNQRIGDDQSDEAVAYLEDMTDTFNDLDQRANGDGTDWEQRYHDLDKQWRDKYRHRFFSGNGVSNMGNGSSDEEETETERAMRITVKDLFS